MKKIETNKLTRSEKLKNIEKLKKDLFNFRFQKINGQLKSPTKITETKRIIARLKTMLKEKQNA
jgi:large subunit ribosomal protein L29